MNLLYKQIEEALRSHTSQLLVPQGTTQEEAYQCIRSIMRENPDIFWFSHQWEYIEDENIIRFHYTISKENTLKAKVKIEDVIQNDFHIDEAIHLSEPEKVMYVYKWIALYCKYNVYSAYSQTIFSVFVYRNSVCTGYAKAAQYLFKILGIESKLVFGTMHNAEKRSRHCWLVVKINNLWYHIDPTFAVPEINYLLRKAGVSPIYGAEELVYNYFCCETETIKQSRIIENENELPKCISAIDFESLQHLPVQPYRSDGATSRGRNGCLLSDSGTTANVYLWHSNKYPQSIVKIYKKDPSHMLLRHEYRVMREMSPSCSVLHIFDTTDNQNGLIIEQATPLADLLCSHYYQLSATNFCKLLLDILAGVQDCINHGIYYRDIHLNNIYRTPTGRYVLGDFGSCIWINRENPSNIGGVGSPWYCAPETYTKGEFCEQSATYGVGMMAYFLLNELLPPLWKEYGEASLNFRIMGYDIPSPTLLLKSSCAFKQQLASVVKKSLSFDTAERYQTLSDLRKAINQCMALVDGSDFLLIEGGSSERIFQSDMKETVKRNGYNFHESMEIEIFHSTCVNFPEILVSNGENELIDMNGVEQEDVILHDCTIDFASNDAYLVDANNESDDESLEEDAIVDLLHTDIDDFAYTAGNPPNQNSLEDNLWGVSPASPSPGSSNTDNSCKRNRIDDFATTAMPYWHTKRTLKTYKPKYESEHVTQQNSNESFWSKIFKKKKTIVEDEVCCSVYAPSEVKTKSFLKVQVFLHLLEEAEKVERLAVKSDKRAELRDYKPFLTKLKCGDTVKVELGIYGESLLVNMSKIICWQGKFTKCNFDYFVPETLNIDELNCVINFYINGVPIGDMSFITNIVEQPCKLNTEIISKMFKRIFISYAHQDSVRVKDFALAYKAQGVDYFFDRDKLSAGDVYEEKIFEYIDSADLFILCWSANAAKSEYVKKECKRAMLHAYPHLAHREATLKIYPISIEPRTELPEDMAGIYNFVEA